MFNSIKELFTRNKLLQISFKNGSQVFVRLAVSFLNIKVIAFFIGPSGMALIGQMQNFLQICSNIVSLGFNHGIVKLTANSGNNILSARKAIVTAVFSILLVSVPISLAIILLSTKISVYLFSTEEYNNIIKYSGVHLILYSLVNLVLSILNGRQNLKYFISINITQSLFSFLVVFIGAYFFGLRGALFAQIFSYLLAFLIVIKSLFKYVLRFKNSYSFKQLKYLGKYSKMTLVSGLVAPLTYFLIRTYIINELSFHMGGVWEGVKRISSTYVMIITLSLRYYLLPTLSKLSTIETKKEISKNLKVLIPILLLGAFSIYLSRNIIITILFTNDFEEMQSLFLWQVIGDFFRVLSWIFAVLFIVKEWVKTYIVTEIVSALIQIGLINAVIKMGLPITIYHAVSYAIYFCILYSIYLRYYCKPTSSHPHQQS